ncbi:hypothetical protein EJD97_004645, partial [Solanum chilense]
MADQRPLISMKKTFFYNFFPSKSEEEACKVNNTQHIVTRELMEIRDLYPAPIIDLQNPWQIKKKITHDEIVVGMLMIQFFLDVNVPKKYDGGSVCLRKVYSDDFALWCIELFKDREMGNGDAIGLLGS